MISMPEPAETRVLLVEDDEDDYLITKDLLAGQDRARFRVDWCTEYGRALDLIAEQRHDIYLVDYRLGRRTGLELVREGFASRPSAPVIILTALSDYEIDLEANELGVTDYLVKQELDPHSLERSIRYAISHQHAISDLARSQERYLLAVRAANDGIWDWDLTSDRIYFSPRWYATLGWPEQEQDQSQAAWFDLVHELDLPVLRAAIAAHLAGRTAYLHGEQRMLHADGSWRWVLTRGLASRGADGTAMRMAGSLSDITERRAAERQLEQDALHDALTGLPNRAVFIDRLEQVLARAERDPTVGCSVLFLDIDQFKLINDSLSHAVGDQLLIALARRVAGVLRPVDTIARLGGDEFTVLLNEVVDPGLAVALAERIRTCLREAFEIEGQKLFVTLSIGISITKPRMTAPEALRGADIAMYNAKRQGPGRLAMFDEDMHRKVVVRVSRQNDLRKAVEQSLLLTQFQPIVDLTTGRVHGFEALVRWPTGWPTVSPLDFIPIAEDTGLIGALGLQVLDSALSALAHWRRSDWVNDDVSISVNVSPRQLDDPGFAGNVHSALVTAGLSGDALRLEITESTLAQAPDRIRPVLAEVCASGVSLHLDDFGTGYSSLGALRQFPVAALKIDRSFVASMLEPDRESDAIVRSIVALAHSLGLGVVAEGIEDPQQLERLRALGCQYGQGYLFSKPLWPAEIDTLLTRWPDSRALHWSSQQQSNTPPSVVLSSRPGFALTEASTRSTDPEARYRRGADGVR
jgi:diguanylate cyclase (GGDEF)-like protein/PAS domain S-box-containing protein